MKLESSDGFRRDMRRIRNSAMRRRVDAKISEMRAAARIRDVSNVRRLSTTTGRHYRIKIGHYRIGVTFEDDTAVLIRFGHRSDFYRSFP